MGANANGSAFEPGKPRDILTFLLLGAPHSGGDYHTYDVSADGQRFLLFQLYPADASNSASGLEASLDLPNGLVIALHWIESLRK